MERRHILLGIIFWVAIVSIGWSVLRSELEAQSSSMDVMREELGHWVTSSKSTYRTSSDYSFQVALGDPIFAEREDGSFRQVGLVTNVHQPFSRNPYLCTDVEIEIYDDALIDFQEGFLLEYHTTPLSLEAVVRTMVPRELQDQIAERIEAEWKQHEQQVMSQMRPVIQQGLRTAIDAVESQLPSILRNHREDFRVLGERYEADILKAELIPLVKREILPIVEEEAVPVARDVGKALWDRVSLWSFTWRYIYDQTPLARTDTVKEEFQRFIDKEALPELRSRTNQFIALTETILKRSMDNPRVREVLKRNFRQVADDPELKRLIWSIVREAVIENETLRLELDQYMKRHETRSAMRNAGNRLEPVVRDIADMIFGSREGGITPEFSRVLRAQILTKDRRWFVIVPSFDNPVETGTVEVDTTDWPMLYPMGFGGQAQSPLTPMGEPQ